MLALRTDPIRQRSILDTNIFNSLFFDDANSALIRQRIAAEPEGTIFLCTVSADELLRGALARIRADETRHRAGDGHSFLADLVKQIATFDMLPFDDAANAVYLAYPAAVRRNGAADCKIAAVAQVNNAVVVTRNTRHFDSIPGIRYEDWTVPVAP
jgi:tRNA(fMet)-specific endonuclease VapC